MNNLSNPRHFLILQDSEGLKVVSEFTGRLCEAIDFFNLTQLTKLDAQGYWFINASCEYMVTTAHYEKMPVAAEPTYRIVRKFWQAEDEEQATGLSLEEARKWCRNPDTREAGKWFDCYEKE